MTGWVRACVADNHCPEARLVDGQVHLRDSRHPDGPVLAFAAGDWQTYVVDEIRAGRDPIGTYRDDTPDDSIAWVWTATDQTDDELARIEYSPAEWDTFCDGVEAGVFDVARLAEAEAGRG